MKLVEAYRAFDGQLFDDEEACREHEQGYALREILKRAVHAKDIPQNSAEYIDNEGYDSTTYAVNLDSSESVVLFALAGGRLLKAGSSVFFHTEGNTSVQVGYDWYDSSDIHDAVALAMDGIKWR